MTVITFHPAYIFHSHRFTAFLAMKLNQLVIIRIFGFDFCFTVTIDTPSHGQCIILPDHIHGFNRTVTGLAFDNVVSG
jgi:hypothetical protein